jgi:hypothetical protein
MLRGSEHKITLTPSSGYIGQLGGHSRQKGQRWCERIWTVMATCAQQGRSVCDYLNRAIEAYFHREKAPSLMPQPG